MKNGLMFFGFITILSVIAFLNEFNFSNEDNPVDVPVIHFNFEDNEEESKTHIPILEYRLDKKEEIDGYIVETYREFEIYKDENGKVIQTIPTENYEFIRYKKY
jgi:hypothetical protein